MKPLIKLETTQVVSVLRDLEFLITSLDRIGSETLSEGALKSEVCDFVIHGDVFKRLAAIRRMLVEAFEAGVSAGECAIVERGLEEIEAWEIRAAKD